MSVQIDILRNKYKGSLLKDDLLKYFTLDEAAKAASFHRTFPGYKATPLLDLRSLADYLKVKKIWLKDESHRFGLNAFKMLGASYAVALHLKEKFSLPGEISYSIFSDENIRNKIKNVTLVTATDGNHGRGVAWTALQLGCKCHVYMPKGTTQNRLNNIKALGADAVIIDGSYDDAVNLAKENSIKYGWLLTQDSSWAGYETMPLRKMRGYLTIMDEIFSGQIKDKPTHVFVQCGVGSLPAAVAAYLVNKFNESDIIFSNVEPLDAACIYESAASNNGEPVSLTNEMTTIMAGLACGTPSTIAWNILKNHADFFIKCSDEVTVKGMRLLANKQFYNSKIISGESGAVTTGLVYCLKTGFPDYCEILSLNENSKILLISTEGDTDPDRYSQIIAGLAQ